MSNFNSLSPTELAILADAVAIALTEGKSADEINVLGNFVAAVGALLLTIAAQGQSLRDSADTKNNNKTKG
ncbi:hypothetical protein JK636_16240 [Clostridium sp. YIM B02515]|uniref:Holin n=1 Tax=Clostridium rhizosphaerae TaxID=2803861 RepID=A0ABS1TG49_9CLOT|nr:hypothetical protein [Clostridium rhizosphaerae]MBL4937279.1 hypothetical protein [Clostridium rhizosphaerae]